MTKPLSKLLSRRRNTSFFVVVPSSWTFSVNLLSQFTGDLTPPSFALPQRRPKLTCLTLAQHQHLIPGTALTWTTGRSFHSLTHSSERTVICTGTSLATLTLVGVLVSPKIHFLPKLCFTGTEAQSKRHISTGKGKKSVTYFYDVLGLSPRATQSQIKSAYYEKSKLHHPDVTESRESHELFRDITEAYEVLGNIKKRRMYDKGFKLHHPPGHSDPADTDYTKAYQERKSNFDRGERPPPPRGKTRIYNFDEFYRQHYNDVRERRGREQKAYTGRNKESEKETTAYAGILLPVLVFMCLFAMTNRYMMDSQDSQERKKR